MRYLMTHSLLSSWLYTMKENPYEDSTNERDHMAEFMQTLRREPTLTTEAMQNGIDFEDLVTAILAGKKTYGFYVADKTDPHSGLVPMDIRDNRWYEAAAKVAGRVRGGVFQYRANKEITVSGITILLHGRLDCLKAGEIIDIKFSKSYDQGKFYDSTQHPMYLELIPEADRFTYLVSNGSGVWSETYRRDETRSIVPDIQDFFSWLDATQLMGLYREKWCAK